MAAPKSTTVIRLRGVRHNNLKNFDLDLPLHRLIVITGLSGSGKSSLAFDTLYAEGQRRYIETFSPYARQFFDRMDKPQVDRIEGIPPAIAIEQRNAVRSTRSTVGTMTEICDHMKVLWPHLAQLHCRGCGQLVRKDSPQNVWTQICATTKPLTRPSATLSPSDGERDGVRGRSDKSGVATSEVLITFDVPLSDKLPLAESLALISKQGYQRLLVNDVVMRLDDSLAQSAIGHQQSAITVIQDRVKLAPAARARFVEACEQAYHFGKGKLTVWEIHPPSSILHPRAFSNRLHCAACNLEYSDPSPALFSFNHPLGACPTCKGFGRTITIDYDLAVPDRSLTLAQGAVKPWRTGTGAESQADLKKFCKARQVPMDVPFQQMSAAHQRWIIEGDKDYGSDEDHQWPRAWYGVKGYFRWLETKSYKMHVRVLLSRYRAYTKCPDCQGARLKPEALLYLISVGDDVRRLKSISSSTSSKTEKSETPHVASNTRLTLPDFYALPVRNALALIDSLSKSRVRHHAPRKQPTDPITHALSEVRARLAYLNEVGLGYLTLDRATRTLSGGETERVNLTTCLGTRLVNTLFVLDEPSVGLHPRDTDRLVRILEKLRDTGNTVIVVEHEASVMRAADQIVDIGPGHGATGGEVVFQGPLPELLKSTRSLTGQYLSGRKQIEIPHRRPVAAEVTRLKSKSKIDQRLLTSAATLRITNATRHNLQDLSVSIPLNRLVALTGVSGSGKSTLVRDILLPALTDKLRSPKAEVGDQKSDEAESTDADDSPTSDLRPLASALTGHESLGQVVLVDQSALGKTPRSNPAVYIGAFDDIREVFAQSEAAKQRGLNTSAFSFNSGVGQCEKCRGAGFEKIEMQFLSDIFIRCPDCNGRRYRQHILEVKIWRVSPLRAAPNESKTGAHGVTRPTWSIGDLLEATVDEAIAFLAGFADAKPAQRAVASLKLLQEVGLGYLRLGQPINTLSGGESQRLKLVRHLAESVAAGIPACRRAAASSPAEKTSTSIETLESFQPSHPSDTNPDGRMPSSTAARMAAATGPRPSTLDPRPTLFLFDEPTTGLHFDDVRVLLQVFQRLVDAGHSVIVIEHNLDVIKCADWVIDLGPEAGDQGGQLVAQGTPEAVAACERSHTGKFLRAVLKPQRPRRAAKLTAPPAVRSPS